MPSAKKRGDSLERRPPVGIARERETRADDAALCLRECRGSGRARLRGGGPTLPVRFTVVGGKLYAWLPASSNRG